MKNLSKSGYEFLEIPEPERQNFLGRTNINRFRFSGYFIGDWSEIIYKKHLYTLTKLEGFNTWRIEHKTKSILLINCKRKNIIETIKQLSFQLYKK